MKLTPFGKINLFLGDLINYWPFTGDLNDEIGESHLKIGENANLVEDRFGNPKSAIRLNNGYLIAPSGTYFYGDFTLTVWIKLNSNKYQSRIIDFGNNDYSDNIEFAFFENSNK